MLTRTSNKSVIGSEGFAVEVLGIHHVRYSDATVEGTFDIEGGQSQRKVYWWLYRDTFRAIRGPITLSSEDNDLVLARISRALRLLGMPNEIH